MENDRRHLIWDKRVLYSFITEEDGEVASTMFAHPSIECNE